MTSDVFSVRLPSELLAQVDAYRGRQTRNAYIKDALLRSTRPWTLAASWDELRRTFCGLAMDAGLSKARFEVELEGAGEWDPERIEAIRVRIAEPILEEDQIAARLNHMDGRIRSLELHVEGAQADALADEMLNGIPTEEEQE